MEEKIRLLENALQTGYVTLVRSLDLINQTLKKLSELYDEETPEINIRRAYCQMVMNVIWEIEQELDKFMLRPH